MNTSLRIHLWAPAAFDFGGGITVFSGFLLRAISSLSPDIEVGSFLKNDTRKRINEKHISTTCCVAGAWPGHLRTFVFLCQVVFWALLKRPKLIITTHTQYAFVAEWLCRLIGSSYWIVAHDKEAWAAKSRRSKRALANAERVLAVSRFTRDRLIQELDLPPDKVVLFPNTFDSRRFRIAAKPAELSSRLKLTKDQPVILTVSRLYANYKRCDQIIRAMPRIQEQFPDVHLLIVGEGPDRERLEGLVNDGNLRNHVTLSGFVSDDELCDYYNLCDVFVMPSDGEGFGIANLEALGCGKPTVAGNRDGAADPLLDGRLGVLVNPDQADEISEAVCAILSRRHPNLRLYDAERLRREALDHFGFERFRLTLSAYLTHFLARKYAQVNCPITFRLATRKITTANR